MTAPAGSNCVSVPGRKASPLAWLSSPLASVRPGWRRSTGNRPEFRRVLFVAHREEILDQAIQVLRQIRPTARICRLAGQQRQIDTDLVFASVQTLARVPHLSRFQPDDFGYIVVAVAAC